MLVKAPLLVALWAAGAAAGVACKHKKPHHGHSHPVPQQPPSYPHPPAQPHTTTKAAEPTYPKPTEAPQPPSYPGPSSGSYQGKALDAHNNVRRRHHAVDLVYDDELAARALATAHKCTFKHMDSKGVGQNLAMGTDLSNPADAIKMWADEEKYYHHGDGYSEQCGHYTQIVWKNTKKVGCGTAKCSNGYFTYCNYYPAGNYIGEFLSQVS